ncbi:GDSL-type esterase/lipase family protein [Maribacter sp. MMG018]|uniref:GDSL-type esterase/lipase family protein n=1 Tax=Maribacter sp. MMG018 TaxID=2822688 RepID=UPI001FFD0E20|nr:GDSL-type esterase/lipase family protein [Maribacter sp. MMG018]
MNNRIHLIKVLLVLFITTTIKVSAQEAAPFFNEVQELSKKYDSIWDNTKETIIFTGSSSIRMWKNLPALFPKYQILNTGFGGSQASDLLYYLDDLVLKYNPKKVFIYEGDNDIFAKKKPKEVVLTTEQIIARIKQTDPTVTIVLLSTKPSLSRWKLRGKYKKLNRKLRRLTLKDESLAFVDVWTPMLDGKKVKNDIFISDGLHMNQKGYDLWYMAIKDFVNNP